MKSPQHMERTDPSSVTRRVAWNLLAGVSGKVLLTLLGLVTFAVLTRSLGAAEFGQYRTVFTYLALAGVLANFGTPALALREMSRADQNPSLIIGNALALRLLLTVLVLLPAVVLVPVFGFDAAIERGVVIGVLGWTAFQLSNVINAVFQYRLKQHLASVAEVSGAALACILTVLFALLNADLYWMLVAFALGQLLTTALAWHLADREVPLSLRADRDTWAYLLRDGWPVGASVLVSTLIARGDLMMLAIFQPAAEVGIYGVASKILEIVLTVPQMLAPLLMPQLMESVSDMDLLQAKVRNALTGVLVLGFPASCLLAWFAKDIISLVAGQEYAQAASVLRIMSATLLVLFVSTLLRFVLLAAGKQRAMLRADLLGLLAAMVGYGLLIPRWSGDGAAVAALGAHSVTLVAALVVVIKGLAMPLSSRLLWQLLPSAVVMIIVLALCDAQGLPWLLAMAASAGAYLATLVASGGLPEELRPRSLPGKR